MAKKVNTEAIAAAAATAVAEPAETVVNATIPATPYIFGEPAPDEVVLSLEKGRFVGISPEFLSVKRGFNVRNFDALDNQEAVKELKEDILVNGWLKDTALTVFVEKDVEDPNLNRIVVWRGETRTRAILAILAEKGPASIPTVPVLLVDLPDALTVAADFQRSNNGKRLAILEQVTVVDRLMAEGITKPSEIKDILGVTHTAVQNIKLMRYSTPSMRQWIAEGLLAATPVLEKIRDLKLDEKSEEDQQVAINGLEKVLSSQATRARNRGKGAGSHGQEEEGEPKPPREQDPDDKAFSKATYLALLTTLRDLYTNQLTPASQYLKQRETIKSTLLSNGLPIVSQKAQKAAKAVQDAAASVEEAAVAS